MYIRMHADAVQYLILGVTVYKSLYTRLTRGSPFVGRLFDLPYQDKQLQRRISTRSCGD